MTKASQGPAAERILLSRQGWEGLMRFFRELRGGNCALERAEMAIGGFAFADSQRDPLVEIIQRNEEIGAQSVVVKGRNGALAIRIVDSGSAATLRRMTEPSPTKTPDAPERAKDVHPDEGLRGVSRAIREGEDEMKAVGDGGGGA